MGSLLAASQTNPLPNRLVIVANSLRLGVGVLVHLYTSQQVRVWSLMGLLFHQSTTQEILHIL